MSYLITKCLCGNSTDFKEYTKNEIPVRECNQCGIIHQDLKLTEAEYFNFYTEKYHTEFQNGRGTPTYGARLDHDRHISDLRFNEYNQYLTTFEPNSPMLDIGSSNNAFVDTLRTNGYNAFGLEIGSEGSKYNKTTYTKDLMEVNFPPNYFSFITLHDVLEHFIDPSKYLTEMFKVTKNEGMIVVDLPNFYVDAGLHHWKLIEHLWFLTQEQATKIFEQHGFVVEKVTTPIPSKIVFYLRKPKQKENLKFLKHKKPTKLLFMPGMGDIYWCLTKAESFIEKNNLGVPEAYIWDLDQKKIGNQQRSENFLSMFSFMDYKGTLDCRRTPEFDMFYAHKDGPGGQFRTKKPGVDPKWIVENFRDFDYVFNVNGFLELGESIENSYSLKNYETNWQPTRFESVDELAYQEHYKNKYGKYIFCYFTGVGVYNTTFNARLNPQITYNMLRQIHRETGASIVLTGTTWDSGHQERVKALDTEGFIHSEINQTNTTQLMALMKQSVGVIGWPAGNTIVAASNFNKPTIIVWSKNLWHSGFAVHCVDPKAVEKTYRYFYVEDFANAPQTLANNIVTTAKEIFR